MLSDPQLEAEANSALYQITPSAEPLLHCCPLQITFHWSDGHLDVTKKLKFTRTTRCRSKSSVSLDGKPLAPADCVARRIRRQGRLQGLAARERLLQAERQAEPAAIQEARRSEKSDPAGRATRPDGVRAGIEDQFFTAAFIPDGTDCRSGIGRSTTTTWPSGKRAGGGNGCRARRAPGRCKCACSWARRTWCCSSKEQPSLEELVQFRLVGRDREAAAFRFAMAAPVHSELGLGHRRLHAGADDGAVPVRNWTFAFHAEDAAVAPEIKSIQDRYKKYSMTDPRKRKMNEEVMAVYQREGINPDGKLPADAAADADPVGVLARADRRHRTAPRAVDVLDSRSFGEGSRITFCRSPWRSRSYLMTKMTPQPRQVDPSSKK